MTRLLRYACRVIPVPTPASTAARRARSDRGLLGALACGVVAAALLAGCGEPEARPPDLLLVTIDSLRADFLGCYGGDPTVGARICSLGEEGTRYAWAFSPSSSSAPSIASILTSTYPSTHGVTRSAATFLHDDASTLAEELRRAGYTTAAFVASPELNRSRNLQQGFDVYDDHIAASPTGGLPTRSAEETTDAAIEWARSAQRPWFIWVHYREPHGPYELPPRPEVEREPAPGEKPGERLRVLATPTGRGGIPGYQAIPGLFTRQGYEARYRTVIRAVDAQLARLILELESAVEAETDAPEHLGVIVTTDHGEAFGEGGWYFSHGQSLGLEQIRVPLVWRPPGGAHPQGVATPVSTLDIAPTLVQAAGLQVPERFEGWALPEENDSPGAPEQARVLFAEHPDYVAVVSDSNFYTRLRAAGILGDGDTIGAEALHAAAARTAVLGDGLGPLPRSVPARSNGIAPLLEMRLDEFLARSDDGADEIENVQDGDDAAGNAGAAQPEAGAPGASDSGAAPAAAPEPSQHAVE